MIYDIILNIFYSINTRKENDKINFLKRYCPKLRTYPNDSINILKDYFFKEEHYNRNSIFRDNENDEDIYFVISGVVVATKSIRLINGLSKKVEDPNYTKVVLETFSNY